jgi:hypothetical protein
MGFARAIVPLNSPAGSGNIALTRVGSVAEALTSLSLIGNHQVARHVA